MSNSSNSDSTEPEDVPGEESEIRGDNPGVGGMPARNVEFTPHTEHEEDPEDEASRGDNPGVGGVPAKDVGGGE
jgi:hypothetical protein